MKDAMQKTVGGVHKGLKRKSLFWRNRVSSGASARPR